MICTGHRHHTWFATYSAFSLLRLERLHHHESKQPSPDSGRDRSHVCRARTEPITTGLINSRCDGLKPSVKCRHHAVLLSDEKPRYFTSAGSLKNRMSLEAINSFGLRPMIFNDTLSRPRCAIPNAISLHLKPLQLGKSHLAWINDSPPSIEKRF